MRNTIIKYFIVSLITLTSLFHGELAYSMDGFKVLSLENKTDKQLQNQRTKSAISSHRSRYENEKRNQLNRDGAYIIPLKYSKIGDKLKISILIDASEMRVPTTSTIYYTPYLSLSASKSNFFSRVEVLGRESYNTQKREVALMNLSAKRRYKSPQKTLRSFSNDSNLRIYTYDITVPYTENIELAKLMIKKTVVKCNGDESNTTHILLNHIYDESITAKKNVPIKQKAPALLAVTTGEKLAVENKFVRHVSNFELEKETFEEDLKKNTEDELVLVFDLGSSEIKSKHENTVKAVTAITELSSSGDTEVAKILIAGYASVDGISYYNERLAEKRAQSLKNYIVGNSSVRPNDIEIFNGGENWFELRKMVENSVMDYKDEVLYIIDNVKDLDMRENELKSIDDGSVYQYMKDNFFENLRVAGYVRVYYKNIDSSTEVSINNNVGNKTKSVSDDDLLESLLGDNKDEVKKKSNTTKKDNRAKSLNDDELLNSILTK